MAEDLDARIASLKQRVTMVQQQRARAEQGYAVAADRAQQVRAALQAEFGVSTHEEAQALAAQLEQELATAVSEAEALLQKAVQVSE